MYLIVVTILGNGISLVAGSLTYNTLLALVPTILVFFSVLSFLPHFADIRDTLQSTIFNLINPNEDDKLEILQVFNNVIAKTSNLGLPSVLSLFVIAFLLVNTIDRTINRNIWQIKAQRKLLQSFTSYWTVISFGPMLLGAILFVKSYLMGVYALNKDLLSTSIVLVLSYAQVFMLWFILFFTYTVFPQTNVKWLNGAVSSLISTIALVLAKNIFVYYIKNIASYYIIYGAIATLPITVFWLYIVWYIILSGATLTKVLNQNNFFTLYRSYHRSLQE
ncbi:YihY family inner membrane protein [Psittacicella hinzii]|uniref:YihY family inner membrane protein n=1 Tax=Psittacicella hinzii TaxID=2028575 RepID=UPI001CA6D553|nr:YihY family inner membrane protein [Psittacicella hinzii]